MSKHITSAAWLNLGSGERFNIRWFGGMFLNWTWIVFLFIGAASLDHWLAYALCAFLAGTRQHAIAILAHDGAHRHASRIGWLNDGATCVLGLWPLGIGIRGYRRYHFAHHRYTNREGDPELIHKRRFSDKWQPGVSWWRLFLTDLLGFAWREVMFALKMMRPVGARDMVGPVLWLGTAITLLLMHDLGHLIVLWYVALYTSFWAVFRMRAYTEHVGTLDTHRLSEPKWWQKCLYLPANTWLHWEHHKWPGVSSWRLKQMKRRSPQ